MTVKMLASVVGLLLVTGACHKDGDGAGGGGGDKITSCNVGPEQGCKQYSAATLDASGEPFLKKLCDASKGTFAHATCPTAKLVAICANFEGDDYSYTPEGPSDAKDCAAIGGTYSKPTTK